MEHAENWQEKICVLSIEISVELEGGNKHVLSLDGGLSNYAGFVCYFGINFLRKNATFSTDT